jgi:hypothetical protein
VALTPTATWVRTVSHTSGQWGSSGWTVQSLAAIDAGGTFGGSSMRVVEMVRSDEGRWGAFAPA